MEQLSCRMTLARPTSIFRHGLRKAAARRQQENEWWGEASPPNPPLDETTIRSMASSAREDTEPLKDEPARKGGGRQLRVASGRSLSAPALDISGSPFGESRCVAIIMLSWSLVGVGQKSERSLLPPRRRRAATNRRQITTACQSSQSPWRWRDG